MLLHCFIHVIITCRAVVGILSGFHFDLKSQVETVTDTEPMEQDEDEDVPELTKMDTVEEDIESQEEGENFFFIMCHIIFDLEKAKALKIHTTITKAIIPELQSCLTKRVY